MILDDYPLTELPNGVVGRNGRFYPYVLRKVQSGSGVNLTPPAPGVRYFVKSVTISTRTTAGDAGTYVLIRATINGQIEYIACSYLVPSTAQFVNYNVPTVGVMTDPGRSISMVYDAVPTASVAVLVVAEVDDL